MGLVEACVADGLRDAVGVGHASVGPAAWEGVLPLLALGVELCGFPEDGAGLGFAAGGLQSGGAGSEVRCVNVHII